jgi:Sec-independent protein translocase protein TatA
MDSLFGIGAPELIVILLLSGIVMGPHRIRKVALWLGRTTAQLQAISRSFVRQLNAELDSVDGGGDIRDTMNEVRELRRQLKDLRREITTAAVSPIQEGKEMLRESKQMIQNSIAPPSLASLSSGGSDAQEGSEQAQPAPDLPKPLEIPDDPEL